MAKQFVIPSVFTAIDKVSAVVDKIQGKVTGAAEKMQNYGKRWEKIGSTAKTVATKTAVAAAIIAAPLALAANDAIKFEDRQADVAKTTGLAGAQLDKFGANLLTLSTRTRTSIEDLQKIAEIGGQLGIDPNQLLPFTVAVNKFNVALGADFAGGVEEAASQVGKIKTLFAQTSKINVADAIIKTGSAINELGAVGAGTSANITDFTLRLGALPAQLKPSLTNTLALGTYLEEVGISAEIGAGGLTKFLLDAGNKLPAFSKQMGISVQASKTLLAQDPSAFAQKFAKSLNGLTPEKLAKKLTALGIGSQESIKVLGALSSGTERLTALQNLSNDAFTKGTSLQSEYNKKNATTAAQLAIAKNNMQAFSITIGTQLLPMLSDALNLILPVVQSFTAWAKENPGLTKTILKVTLAVAGFLAVISGISTIVAGYASLVAIVSGLVPVVATIGGLFANYLVPALQVVWATLTVITEMVAGALGVGVGAVVAVFLVLASVVASVWRNWDMLVSSFKNGGIIEGLKAIGKVLLDAVLWPLQKILQIASHIPGVGKFAAQGASAIESARADMGLSVEAVNPKKAQQDALTESISTNNNNKNVNIKFSNAPAGTTVDDGNGVMPVTTSTFGLSH